MSGSGIFSGKPAEKQSYPFLVKVYMDKFFCGGTLITPKAVLTAAHCLHHEDEDRWALNNEISIKTADFANPN